MVDDRGRILLLDRDVLLAGALTRTLANVADVVVARTCGSATRVLAEREPWLGFICDVALRDGSGLDWLASARKAGYHEPALVLTSRCQPAFVNRAFSLRASYLCKPFERDALRTFVVDIAMRHAELEEHSRVRQRARLSMSALAWRLSVDFQLTPSEVEIVTAALRGATRQDLVDARGISMNTLKTQVKSALRKLGADSIADARRLLESQVLEAGSDD